MSEVAAAAFADGRLVELWPGDASYISPEPRGNAFRGNI